MKFSCDKIFSERTAGFADAGRNFIDTADNYQRGASAKPSVARLGNNRKNMVQPVEASLKRLGTDRIDLYFVHMDESVTTMEEIARGLDDLARAGKIVYGGLSNFPA